jgi:hypothetical protein
MFDRLVYAAFSGTLDPLAEDGIGAAAPHNRQSRAHRARLQPGNKDFEADLKKVIIIIILRFFVAEG